MNGYTITALVAFGMVWCLVMCWKAGLLRWLDRNMGAPAVATDAPRRYEKPAFLGFALVVFGFAYSLSDTAFLSVLYGFSIVRVQHLHFLEMPNGHPWRVSNGDEIPVNLHPLHFGLVALIWLVLTLLGFALVRRILPEERPSLGNHRGVNGARTSHPPAAMERRVWGGAGHLHRRQAMGIVACWILVVVGLCVFAQWIGRLSLWLALVFSMGCLGYYIRLRERHFIELMKTTACPGCGLLPMRFDTGTGVGDTGVHRLLVCERCGVEWDFGPL